MKKLLLLPLISFSVGFATSNKQPNPFSGNADNNGAKNKYNFTVKDAFKYVNTAGAFSSL